MPREKKPPEAPKGAPAWMVTWSDMVTLLLCFFVMLLALSSMDPAKFNAVASSFQNAFGGVLESFPSVLITRDVFVPKMGGDRQNKRMAIEAADKVRKAIEREKMDGMTVTVTESGIAIRIDDPIGFESGSADLKPQLHGVLRDIAGVINDAPTTQIMVQGHTDNVPISNARFPSNWELSAARALSVVRHLAQNGGVEPARLSAVGYGEYRPIVPNTTSANRRTNRRIEIYVDYIEKKENRPAAFSLDD